MITPFTHSDIKTCLGPGSYELGMSYFQRGAVQGNIKRINDFPDFFVLSGAVKGSRSAPYRVSVDWDGETFDSECTCSWRSACKHVAALLIAYLANEPAPAAISAPAGWQVLGKPTQPATPTPPGWRVVIGQLSKASAPPVPPAPLVYRLKIERDAAVSRDILLASVWVGDELVPPGLVYRLPCAAGTLLLVNALRQHLTPSLRPDGWSPIADASVDAVLQILAVSNLVEDEAGHPLTILPGARLRRSFEYVRDGEDARLRPGIQGPDDAVPNPDLPLVGSPAAWTQIGHTLHPLDAGAPTLSGTSAPIHIPAGDRPEFERRYLPDLMVKGQLSREGGQALPTIKKGKPLPQLLLEEVKGKLHGRLGFIYGGVRVEADEPTLNVGPPDGPWYSRAPQSERKLLDLLPQRNSYSWIKEPPKATFDLAGDTALDFLLDELPRLMAKGVEVLGEDRLTNLRISRGTPFSSFTVSSGIDWLGLEGTVSIDDEMVPWPALWQALTTQQRYVRLGSGRQARLPKDWLASQRAVLENLGLDWDKLGKKGGVRVPRYQAPALEAVLANADECHTDAPWREFISKLRTFGGIAAVPVPDGFQGALRPYQAQGLNYLAFLRDFGLGGILADDMGLGKTVQAAALLLANHGAGGTSPSLVVAPASVIANWQMELARFAPALRTLIFHGAGRDTTAIDGVDVVITTYATARADIVEHQRHTYHTVILDEAQNIKNPESQTARALRSLSAQHRLCLTGTPVENNLMDLWSQFAFVMPGLLGTPKDFKESFVSPIAAGDARALATLKSRAGPFILRRLKQDVATELPPRQDIVVWCDMPEAQRKLYDTVLAISRARVMAAVEETGLARNQITILAALLKLRQVCCHPALLATPETLHLPSAKFEAFGELVHELIEGGHRALVFSQFTSMLAHLREWLDAHKIAYEYLDGSTPKRQARVDRFNQGEMPLFLISLKAGGTGLNLTGADYVIHYDPWWNPAVEDQATDRAHRIGQTRQVFNYKLLCRGTIEEKLLGLQDRKRALVKDLLEADTIGKSLTLQDLEFLFGDTSPGKPHAAVKARQG